jgi:hypothetical protein
LLVPRGTRRGRCADRKKEKRRMEITRGDYEASAEQSSRRSEIEHMFQKPSVETSKPTNLDPEGGEDAQIDWLIPRENPTRLTNREERSLWYTNGGKEWGRLCRRRDGYKCQMCGKRPKRVTVHHIYPFHSHPELRSELDNGVCLCFHCHKALNTTWGEAWNQWKQEQSGLVS